MILATKTDIGAPDPRSVHALSATSGQGLTAFAGLIESRLAEAAGADPRQQHVLGEADALLEQLLTQWLPDEILATQLRVLADLLGDLLGVTTDEVLGTIFARFCIGK